MKQITFIKRKSGYRSCSQSHYSITMEIHKYLVEKYTLTNGYFQWKSLNGTVWRQKDEKLAGLSMIEVRKIFPNMLIVAISRNGKIIIPHGQTTIEDCDTLYLIGERSEIHNLHKKKYTRRGKYTNLQKVMIVGGGKTGFLSQRTKLSEFGIAVKVIEKDKDRCYYLSTHLDDVMILHGDATDTSLLDEENIDEMDAFVTATGLDEENLLLALMAKRAV